MLAQQDSLTTQQVPQSTGVLQPVEQQQPIVLSPSSTLPDENTVHRMDAAALAAAYRLRIAQAAASPAPAATTQSIRTTSAARLLTFVNNSPHPTPTVHGNDQHSVQNLERKWKLLYGTMKSHSQAAADVLMKQAQSTSQVEELVQLLLTQLKAGAEERLRLQQLVLQERSQLMAQAEEAAQLHQRLHSSEHLSTAVQVVTESLQGQLSQAREALEASSREKQGLAEQVAQLSEQVRQLTEQLSVTTECRTRGDALIAEQAAVIETLRQQLQEQAATASQLAEDKADLESQLQGVLRAEQELTGHLRETHAAIEGQLAALRDQLKAERQKRAAVVKRRGELQGQVEQLQAQVAAQQAEMTALVERLARGGGVSQPHATQPAPARGPAQPPSHVGPTASSSAKAVALQAAAHVRHTAAAAGGAVPGHRLAAGMAAAAASPAAAAGASSAAGTAAGAADRRSRSTLRPSSANGRPASKSPTTSTASGVRRPASARRSATHSPSASAATEGELDEASSGPSTATATPVTLHVPSSLTPFDESKRTAPPRQPMFEKEAVATAHGSNGPPQAAQHERSSGGVATGAQPPPSPPINLPPYPAQSTDQGGGGGNRRRSISPEPSRASLNAVQHARRASPGVDRANKPNTAAMGTWLP
ncbi:hypothetical protein Agub_g1063 [Astrephomene gubernaculifera]|uniref:Uncharacterized protein n=1 Tax=Astrephomene gubernaculifera TaxID=47775 RepID=A0AAD3DEV3_9CHLO|nr:hypothetical protein Agub_g1063 [Astrephomene gubernaculifera]